MPEAFVVETIRSFAGVERDIFTLNKQNRKLHRKRVGARFLLCMGGGMVVWQETRLNDVEEAISEALKLTKDCNDILRREKEEKEAEKATEEKKAE